MDRSRHRVESTSKDPYAHVKLPMGNSTTIRLLEILPLTPEDSTSILRCKLHLASTSDTYTAVSYTWGQEKNQQTIELNGIQTPIRENLWEFLHQERTSQKTSGARKLWIDFLCIQQNLVSEKNHQVALMGSIYSNASSVAIWLGAVVRTDPLLCIGRLKRLKKGPTWQERVKQGPTCDASYPAEIEEWERELRRFVDHTYWSRAWILQECVLAARLEVRCEQRLLTDIDLYELQEELRSYEVDRPYEDFRFHKGAKYQANVYPFFRVYEARTLFHDHTGRKYVNPFTMAKAACADPRDRIYSVLAIVHPSLALPPHYGKTGLQLFVELADHHLGWSAQRSGRLRWLANLLEVERWDPAVHSRIRSARMIGK